MSTIPRYSAIPYPRQVGKRAGWRGTVYKQGTRIMEYKEFLQQKTDYGSDAGFEPLFMPDFLFDFQSYLTDWAIRKGRDAVFADCGMGKTPMQLVWAENVVRKTNKPVLIITPLAVSGQTLEEAEKFGIDARVVREDSSDVIIQITNYEKLFHFDSSQYGGVVCDESSILKNFDGARKSEITEFMRRVPYRLLCTATAAPNDWVELGTSSEALGYLGYMDMLTKFFKRKQTYALTDRVNGSKEWNLRAYAEHAFWRWVASWARAARMPADLGFDNDGFVLPELVENLVPVQANAPTQGMLFDMPAINFREEREAMRRTITERCEMVAELVSKHKVSMVWCNLNDEGDLLEQLIPNSVQVSGSDSDEKKEEAAHWFVHGKDKKRVLISKVRIYGFGLNFQHCSHMTYFPTHSYEQYYQASRRLWRFGQKSKVVVDQVYTKGTERMMESMSRKSDLAGKMFEEMIAHMNEELKIKIDYKTRKVGIPQWLTSK